MQTVDEQRAFAERVGLTYPLLADPERRLAAALGLPTFTAGGRTFYKRLTLVTKERRIVKVFYPVLAPDESAAEVIDWLVRHER